MTSELNREKKPDAPGPSQGAEEPLPYQALISICAVFVAGVGSVSLLGWVLGLPVLASLGSGRIPVAPSTAVLFILYAVSMFLRARLLFRRWAYMAALGIHAAGVLLSTLLFVLSLLGIQLEAEHFGFYVLNKPGELQVGHMSPVTAFCFLLSSVSYLLSLPLLRGRRWPANSAWWLSLCLIVIGSTLVLAYLYGMPMLYGSSFIPPAALTSMAFSALGTVLLLFASPRAWPSGPDVESTTRASYTFSLVFVILASGIVVSGYLYYRNYEMRHRKEVEHQLTAIADLKVDELIRWRKERLGDAALFYNNPNFSGLVLRYLQKPADKEAQARLRTWLQHVREGYQYDRVLLLDPGGRELMSVPAAEQPVSRHLSLSAAAALQANRVTLEDFYRDEHDGRVYLAVLVPLVGAGVKVREAATLVLRIDPEDYFYPFLSRWPTPSMTAETLLVRREGNEALFLNELRFQKNTALNLRGPLDQKELPAAQAVLGRKGIMEGRDYRGVQVLADLRAVPDSPWFLVSRMDISEVYGPVSENLWTIVLLVITLLAGAGAAFGMVWRQQLSTFYRVKYESAMALNESQERLKSTIEELQRSNTELEQFAYVASHDLQEPLRMVASYTQLLAERYEDRLDDKAKKFIRYAVDGAVRMQLLINDLLAYSRIGTRGKPLEPVDANAALGEALANLKVQITGAKALITNDELPKLQADASQLVQLFQNLIGNAVKFHGAALPHIHLSAADKGREWLFSVRDNGIGIDPQYADKVFVIFQRLHTKEEYPGSGIGLAVCKKIVERHGGRIWFESEPGKGTIFYFTIAK
ncbi:MAG: sensor histidine kinase [Thermodesulfovibrionales bacterium]